LYIDGVLVPAWNLVNGTSVKRNDAEHLDVIEYFHIVLDQHDVIDAEGSLCDTFLETTGHTAMSDDRGEEYDGAVLPAVCVPRSPVTGCYRLRGRAELANGGRQPAAQHMPHGCGARVDGSARGLDPAAALSVLSGSSGNPNGSSPDCVEPVSPTL
jgi:hypothetical protein